MSSKVNIGRESELSESMFCFLEPSPLRHQPRYINTRIVAQEHGGLLAFAAFAPLSVPLLSSLADPPARPSHGLIIGKFAPVVQGGQEQEGTRTQIRLFVICARAL